MRKFRWQLGLVAIALLLVAILLLGQQPLLGGLIAEPAEGGLYIEGLVGSMSRLNPLFDFSNSIDQDVNSLLYSGLIRFDERGNPIPDLAEEWGVSLDGLTYNVRLRSDAFWHDGTPVTSADVVFTTNLLSHQDSPIQEHLRAFWQAVEVIAFDEHNLQFRLSQAFAPFLDYLGFGLLPEHILGNTHPVDIVNSSFNSAPIGTGPFAFEEILIEDGAIIGVVLKSFENYYFESPFVSQIVFRYYDNSKLAYEAYQEGEILGIGNVDQEILSEVLKDNSLNVFSSRLPKLALLVLNLDNSSVPFFQELEVRQALMHGTNRQWLVDSYLNGQAYIADGPILPGIWAFNANINSIPFDTQRAISILKEAGYTVPSEGGSVRAKDGLRLSFELLHPDTKLHTQIAESIRSDWAQLGVSIELNAQDYATLLSDYLEPRNFEAALIDLNLGNSPDPDPYPFWHQAEANSGQNYSRWDDRRASEYLEQARVSINHNQRIRLYRNFQIHFIRELPALPLYYPVYNYAISSLVQGVSIGPLFHPSDRFANINEWFLVARGAVNEQENPADN